MMIKTLYKSLKNTLYMMEKTKLKINSPIKVMISKKLSFMGYTTEKDGRHLIVVSGKVLEHSQVIACLNLASFHRNAYFIGIRIFMPCQIDQI